MQARNAAQPVEGPLPQLKLAGMHPLHAHLLLEPDAQGSPHGLQIPGRTPILTLFDALDVAPATQDLVGAEIELVNKRGREGTMRAALATVADDYEYVLIDCPPSLGLLTLNMLVAADVALIPIQCEYYALEGITQLLHTIELVQQNLNPLLEIEGVLLTMYDKRLNLANQVAEEARRYFGGKVYESVIPRNVKLSESPSFAKPILYYDAQSSGAESYMDLAREVIDHADWRAAPQQSQEQNDTAVEEA